MNVARAWGDADLEVVSPPTLAFDSENYDTPQSVTLAAAADADLSGW